MVGILESSFVLSKAEFEHLRSQIGTTNFSKTRAMPFALFADWDL